MSQNMAHRLVGEADTSPQANINSNMKDCGELQEGRCGPQRRSSKANLLRNLRGAASEWKSVTLEVSQR